MVLMRILGLAAGLVLLLTGCTTSTAPPAPTPSGSPSATADPAETPEPTETPDPMTAGPVRPEGAGLVVGNLDVPWSVVRLDSGSTLISERDRGAVRELTPEGALRDLAIIPDVAPGGEGGLLGLAVRSEGGSGEDESDDESDADADTWLYAYYTTATDNRIVRFPLLGAPGDYRLGAAEPIVTGLPKASNHNGGRLAFGPDGMLYATVGDASVPGAAQNLGILAGKILRMTPDGGVPDDNPWAGSFVYSLGHRNPQGLAWDGEGRLWATEFGQDTWDELNLIVPGGNYGWPDEEGIVAGSGYRNPIVQWSPDEASPSGLTYVRDTLFAAGLGGQRLWSIALDRGLVLPWFVGQFGRIRDVVPGPDGTLWMLTNNTDGRGTPREGDDLLLQVSLYALD